tara:strand:- start:868 stop:1062 length:195 start_codon:yes stop_codon:yes gene_type:complete
MLTPLIPNEYAKNYFLISMGAYESHAKINATRQHLRIFKDNLNQLSRNIFYVLNECFRIAPVFF